MVLRFVCAREERKILSWYGRKGACYSRGLAIIQKRSEELLSAAVCVDLMSSDHTFKCFFKGSRRDSRDVGSEPEAGVNSTSYSPKRVCPEKEGAALLQFLWIRRVCPAKLLGERGSSHGRCG
jgi:hypothetical protein